MLHQPEKSAQSSHLASLEFVSGEERSFYSQPEDVTALSPAECTPPSPTCSGVQHVLPHLNITATERRALGLADGVSLHHPISKAPLNLRLPSFQMLGIAAPHPDNLAMGFDNSIISFRAGSPSERDDSLHTTTTCLPTLNSPWNNLMPRLLGSPIPPLQHPPAHKAVQQYVLTQTPPDDNYVIDWSTSSMKTTTGGRKEGQEDPPHQIPPTDADATSTSLSKMTLKPPDSSFSSKNGVWVNQALPSIRKLSSSDLSPPLLSMLISLVDNVRRNNSSEHLRVLSHALPSPSSEGHAFPAVIEAIQQATDPNSITWMNIFHAVTGKFSLADLPKSPPTTPAPPNEGDDYFTTRVFNMAVEVPDYSEKIAARPLLQKLRPAISPSSIDISVVERYIPPTSTTEFEELFTVTGRSFLSDRLIELSTKHGTLLFIYPTKVGGTTFKNDYLAPILDPILRELGTTHDLSIDLLQAIGSMTAIEKLFSFEEMKARLQEFCRSLSVSGSTPHGSYHTLGATYTVVHSSTQCVPLGRTVWAEDWWAKQEKIKIQKAFENYDVHKAGVAPGANVKHQLATAKKEAWAAVRPGADNHALLQRAKTQELMRAYERTRGEKRPDDNEMLILKLLQDLAIKPYPRGEPTKGVEVGVFVVKKTLREEGISTAAFS
jgi:hypothetical protein